MDTATVEEEVEKAKGFKPPLSEYLILTSAPRDTTLQQEVRTKSWPFRVHVMFWDSRGVFVYTSDVELQIILNRGKESEK
jgi:hypothetical protein